MEIIMDSVDSKNGGWMELHGRMVWRGAHSRVFLVRIESKGTIEICGTQCIGCIYFKNWGKP